MSSYSKNLQLKLWDILREGDKTVLEYLESINNTTNSAFATIDEAIGNTNQLQTQSRNIVGAVNEVLEQTENKASKTIATTSANGLMSAVDKTKLDTIEVNANNYTHPTTHSIDVITGLSNVAKTGNYNDLSGKPIIPNVTTKLEASNIKAGQNITVAIDGNNVTINSTASGGGDVDESLLNEKITQHNNSINSHTDIRNSIPVRLGQLQNDVGYLTTVPLHNHDESYFSKSEFEDIKPSLKGDKGDKGDEGDKGDVGNTPRIAVGEVITLHPNDDAIVETSGTEDDIILSFGIPRGGGNLDEPKKNTITMKKWRRDLTNA